MNSTTRRCWRESQQPSRFSGLVVQAADTRELLDKPGAEPLTSSPAELAALVRDGVAKYAKIIKTAGIKPE